MLSQDWLAALGELMQELRQFLPAMLAAAALVLVGLLIGRLLQNWGRRLTASALHRLSRNVSVRGALDESEMPSAVPKMVGLFVFWLVFLFFAASALEVLGLPVVTDSLSRFVYYLPNVLAAALIVAAGLVIGSVARGAVGAAATSAGVAAGPLLGRLAHAVIILTAGVVALEELGIDSSALVVMITVVFGSILLAIGLAFGLGARSTVSNIISAQHLARTYKVGQTVRIADVEGRIVETTPTAVIVATEAGRVMVPASRFSKENSILLGEAS